MLDRPAVGSCCSMIDSGRGPISLSFFFIHCCLIAKSWERGYGEEPLLPCDEWSTSPIQRGDKLTQSPHLICHWQLFPRSKQTPPDAAALKQTRTLMQNNVCFPPFWSGTPRAATLLVRLWLKAEDWGLVMRRRMTMQCWFITKRGHSNPCFRSVTRWQAWDTHWWWDWDTGSWRSTRRWKLSCIHIYCFCALSHRKNTLLPCVYFLIQSVKSN